MKLSPLFIKSHPLTVYNKRSLSQVNIRLPQVVRLIKILDTRGPLGKKANITSRLIKKILVNKINKEIANFFGQMVNNVNNKNSNIFRPLRFHGRMVNNVNKNFSTFHETIMLHRPCKQWKQRNNRNFFYKQQKFLLFTS